MHKTAFYCSHGLRWINLSACLLIAERGGGGRGRGGRGGGGGEGERISIIGSKKRSWQRRNSSTFLPSAGYLPNLKLPSHGIPIGRNVLS